MLFRLHKSLNERSRRVENGNKATSAYNILIFLVMILLIILHLILIKFIFFKICLFVILISTLFILVLPQLFIDTETYYVDRCLHAYKLKFQNSFRMAKPNPTRMSGQFYPICLMGYQHRIHLICSMACFLKLPSLSFMSTKEATQ